MLLPLVVVDEDECFSSDASTTDRRERTRAKERILEVRLASMQSKGGRGGVRTAP